MRTLRELKNEAVKQVRDFHRAAQELVDIQMKDHPYVGWRRFAKESGLWYVFWIVVLVALLVAL